MIWSITKAKMFSKCQRKWFFYDVLAHARSKDPIRREAYILKQLQTLSGWRGSLVDKVITNLIIPSVKRNDLVGEDRVLEFATGLIKEQIAFALAKKYAQPGMIKSRIGDIFCAFYDIEYDGQLNPEGLESAKEDVVTALKNLLHSSFLDELMKREAYVVAQRPLLFNFEGVSVKCTPDLLVFYKEEYPLIVDWKVHWGNSDAWLKAIMIP